MGIMKKRKLTTEDIRRIIEMVEHLAFTQAETARMFTVTRARVHHILNNTYGDRDRLHSLEVQEHAKD